MKKRSQSALEFLITYGWAIMIVIAMIVALSYLGVLDLSKFLPSTCMSTVSIIPCIGNPVAQSGTNELSFLMSNELGYRLDLTNDTITIPYGCTDIQFCDQEGNNCVPTRSVSHHEQFMVLSDCTFLSTRYTGTYVFHYVDSVSSLSSEFQVRISAKVR
jgi:hypothetical protein